MVGDARGAAAREEAAAAAARAEALAADVRVWGERAAVAGAEAARAEADAAAAAVMREVLALEVRLAGANATAASLAWLTGSLRVFREERIDQIIVFSQLRKAARRVFSPHHCIVKQKY